MTKKKTPAPAAKKDVPQVVDFDVVRMTRIPRGDLRLPAAIVAGDAPSKGDQVKLTMQNGSVYQGVVHDAAEIDGETLIEFRDGLTPVATK